jgi:hypothetical protein
MRVSLTNKYGLPISIEFIDSIEFLVGCQSRSSYGPLVAMLFDDVLDLAQFIDNEACLIYSIRIPFILQETRYCPCCISSLHIVQPISNHHHIRRIKIL